jgi:hypothetical protein
MFRCARVLAAGALALAMARDARACDDLTERVVGYSVGSDRLAERVEFASTIPPRVIVRRLSTGEPLDAVTCTSLRRCELTDVLGMKGCSFTPLHASKATHGLGLEPPAEGSRRWVLSQEIKEGRLPLVGLLSTGTLELRAVRFVGRRVLVVVRETRPGMCPSERDHVVPLDEPELRPGRARVEQAHADVDLDAPVDALPPAGMREAPPFRAMPARTVVRATRHAVATGMSRLATCWLQHNAAAMAPSALADLRRRVAEDPELSALGALAREPEAPRSSSSRHHASTARAR